MKVLERLQFGNPILRKPCRQLLGREITSPKVQSLIEDMRHTLVSQELGVGLAAPQIGRSIALAVVAIRPTEHRPKAEVFDLVLINPKLTERVGKAGEMWEGCLSTGSGGRADLFAKVPRHKTIKVSYQDETGRPLSQVFAGLPAQVIQHEIDHLNGILFVDHVKDSRTYMTYQEYIKRVKASDS